MKDTLGQFAQLKSKLTAERETITKRLAAINAVLGIDGLETVPVARKAGKKVQTASKKGKRRAGKLTLDQAVLDAFGGEQGNGKTIGELIGLVQSTAGKTHKVTRPTVSLACLRLKKKGQVKSVARGVYALA